MKATIGAAVLLAALVPLSGCRKSNHSNAGSNNDAGVDGGSTDTINCADYSYTRARVRRLTRAEFNHSVSDLLGTPVNVGSAFAAEDEVNGYSTHDRLEVSTLLAEQIDSAVEQLAHDAVHERGELPPLAPCDEGEEETCVRSFIQSFGKKAFRRPVMQTEENDLYALFLAGRGDEADYQAGIELLVQGFLESPQFLYRTELGDAPDEGAKFAELTPYEVAAAISYFVIGSGPDDALLEAAAADELRASEQREAHARRLMDDPRARPRIRQFVSEWLGLKNLSAVQKDSTVYPEFDGELRASLQAETDAFVDYVVFDGDHSLSTLLSADFTFADSRLARLYGLPEVQGEAVQKVSLTSTSRRGLLNQGGFFATYAHRDETSPIRRGKVIWTRLLCQIMPDPPGNVNISPPEKRPNTTTRTRYTEHTQNQACAVCHEKIDPIGFGMEDFDGIGRLRDSDNGVPVDASGEVRFTKASSGTFTGGAQLAQRLAGSADVNACVNRQLFRYTMGRLDMPDDACVLDRTRKAFEGRNNDVREIIISLIGSEDFVRRQVVQP
jgi:hypothetical protein